MRSSLRNGEMRSCFARTAGVRPGGAARSGVDSDGDAATILQGTSRSE